MLFLSYGVVGLVIGCLYALTACGLVVTYSTTGIFNFAQGAIGMFLAFTYWQLAVPWGLPWYLAMLIVLGVIAPFMGLVVERVLIRPLHGAPLGVTLMVTLGLLLALLGAADALWKNTVTRDLPVIFAGTVKIFGVVVTDYDIMVLIVSIAVAVGLRVLFTRTWAGITMRAIVDDRELTARSGASPERTAQLSWVLSCALAGLAGILIGGGRPPLEQLDQLNLTILVISGYAAAVVGRLRSLPLTVGGALLLGLLGSWANGYLPNGLESELTPVIPFALLFLVLLILPQDRLKTAALGGGRTRRITGLRSSVLLAGAFVAACAVATEVLSPGNLITFGTGITLGIVMLSLVLLTGYGGQVSLCQMTLAGMGAYFMGKVAGGSSIVGLGAAIVLPALIGAVLGFAVLRLRGLYLALATLAFAYGMDNLFFNREMGFGGIEAVGRVGFTTQRGYLMEAVVLFALLGVGVLALRRGPFGRQLRAMNDSEMASASLGMNITLTKLVVFAIAAGIAGLGGALYGGWQREVGPNDFQMLFSLIVLLLVTLGGIDTVAGAFAAAIFYALQPVIQSHVHVAEITYLLIGLGAVGLGQNAGGMIGQASAVLERLRRPRVPAIAIGGDLVHTGG